MPSRPLPASANFAFLREFEESLVLLGAQAESVPLAPRAEQDEVARRVNAALDVIATLETRGADASRACADLDARELAAAFRGELDPALFDEPAQPGADEGADDE